MNTLIPGAPLRSLSPTSNEYQRAEGVSRAAKPARVARFTLDAPEHSGTIPGARGDILTPGVALTSNLAVIFTLNQHKISRWVSVFATEPRRRKGLEFVCNYWTGQGVLPPLSVGEMTLRLYGALNYSQNSARDLRCALNGA